MTPIMYGWPHSPAILRFIVFICLGLYYFNFSCFAMLVRNGVVKLFLMCVTVMVGKVGYSPKGPEDLLGMICSSGIIVGSVLS